MKHFIFAALFLSISTVRAQTVSAANNDQEALSAHLESILIKDDHEGLSRTRTSADRIEQNQAEDVKEALKGQSEVFVGGGQKSAQKIYVRGVEDMQLNVTVDGARQSGYLFHHQGRLSVDTELLKQIDVEAGTGDALAGPGALGGALRFATKDPSDLLLPGQRTGALLKAGYGTNADMKSYSAGFFGLVSDNLEYLFYGNLSDSANYRAGGGDTVNYTAGKPYSLLGKFVYTPSTEQKLSFSANTRQDNARRSLRNHFGDLPFNPPNEQKFGNDSYTLQHQYTPASEWVQLRTELYTTTTHLSQETSTAYSEAFAKSYGGQISNKMRFTNFDVTVGTDFNLDRAESVRTAGMMAETSRIFGLFSQGHYRWQRWTLGAGLRYDNYDLEDVYANELNAHHVSPNVKLSYAVNDVWTVLASWSQAFKGPTPMEAYVMSGVKGVAPANNLKGTTAETSELGLQTRLEKLLIKTVAYATIMKDTLQASTNRTTGILTRSNAREEQKYRGVNFSGQYEQNAWVVRGGYSHNKAEFGDEVLGGAVSTMGSSFGDRFTLGIDYRWTEMNLLFSWDSLVALKMIDVAKTSPEQPGYDIHDISVQWVPQERLRVGAAVSNIFDKKYVAQGTPYQTQGAVNPIFEQGADARFSVSYLF